MLRCALFVVRCSLCSWWRDANWLFINYLNCNGCCLLCALYVVECVVDGCVLFVVRCALRVGCGVLVCCVLCGVLCVVWCCSLWLAVCCLLYVGCWLLVDGCCLLCARCAWCVVSGLLFGVFCLVFDVYCLVVCGLSCVFSVAHWQLGGIRSVLFDDCVLRVMCRTMLIVRCAV